MKIDIEYKNMKNLFVPLTIAIKLKELGFNEP
jgi:hypothetical protein